MNSRNNLGRRIHRHSYQLFLLGLHCTNPWELYMFSFASPRGSYVFVYSAVFYFEFVGQFAFHLKKLYYESYIRLCPIKKIHIVPKNASDDWINNFFFGCGLLWVFHNFSNSPTAAVSTQRECRHNNSMFDINTSYSQNIYITYIYIHIFPQYSKQMSRHHRCDSIENIFTPFLFASNFVPLVQACLIYLSSELCWAPHRNPLL